MAISDANRQTIHWSVKGSTAADHLIQILRSRWRVIRSCRHRSPSRPEYNLHLPKLRQGSNQDLTHRYPSIQIHGSRLAGFVCCLYSRLDSAAALDRKNLPRQFGRRKKTKWIDAAVRYSRFNGSQIDPLTHQFQRFAQRWHGVAGGITERMIEQSGGDAEDFGRHALGGSRDLVGNGLVTSRNPNDIPVFNRKLIEEMSKGKHEPETSKAR